MEIQRLLEKVVERGIKEVKYKYPPSDKLNGAIAGFRSCLDLDVHSLKLLLESSRLAKEAARAENDERYWWYCYYALQVEWTCNCISVLLVRRQEEPIIPPTNNAVINVSTILAEEGES